jgi:hypothetical protein
MLLTVGVAAADMRSWRSSQYEGTCQVRLDYSPMPYAVEPSLTEIIPAAGAAPQV